MAIVTGSASTLEQIKARLKEINQGPQDLSILPTVTHKASGLSFRVGPMSREEYDSWDDLKTLEELQHESSGALQKKQRKNTNKSDKWLLTHAVFADNGEKLDEETVGLLFNGKGFGPSTKSLISAAEIQNPPKEQLSGPIQMMWGADASNIVFWRVVKEAGLFKMLLNFLAASATEEEKAVAEKELGKVEETLLFWEAGFEADEAARRMEIGVYDRIGKPSFENLVAD